MFTANSMNCLTEALGLSLPGNGSTLATHADRKQLFLRRRPPDRRPRPALLRAGRRDRAAALHRHQGRLRERHDARHRHGRLDQHRAAPAGRRPRGRASTSPWPTSTALSRKVPLLCKVAPAKTDVPHGGRAPRRRHHGHPRRARPRPACSHRDVPTVHARDPRRRASTSWDITRTNSRDRARLLPGRARRRADPGRLQPGHAAGTSLDPDRENGCIRSAEHAFSKDGGLAVLYGNIALDGCIVKTAGVDESHPEVHRPGPRLREPGRRGRGASSADEVKAGDVVVIRYEGPQGRPRHAGDALPDQLPEVEGPGQGLRAAHRRPLLRRHLGPVDRPRLAGGGRGRRRSAWCATATSIEIDIPNRTINLRGRRGRTGHAAAPSRTPRAGSRPSRASAR